MSEVDVAIVGCGPVGAALANLLGLAGLRVTVLERETSVYHQPRAGHFDGEVMRVFQAIGAAEAIAENTFVSPGMRFVNARGDLLLDWSRPQTIGPQGWYGSYRFHQPDLERKLRANLARFPQVEIRTRCDVFDVADEGARVTLRYEDLATGTLAELRARYVVGCDGARSIVRRFMGTGLEDLRSHERWLIVDMILDRPRPDLPVETVQVCDPARPTTVIKMVGQRRRWELMLMPGDDPNTITRPREVWRLLAPWMKPEEGEIERAVVYTFHSVLAEGWRRGRLLLAGDSCHQTPPFMGQGMCAGIRDAANLAWKLAAVIGGRAGEELLDSYEVERAPHVREYIETAVRLGRIIQPTDPAAAAKRDAEMVSSPPRMVSIAPRLGPGLHGAASAPAGTLARQPRLADGRRLDDAAGPGFVLLCSAAFQQSLSGALRALCAQPGLALVADDGAEVTAWLAELGAGAVVIRPDRYILGTAATAAELPAILGRLPAPAADDARALRSA